jgi:hypothetical protein
MYERNFKKNIELIKFSRIKFKYFKFYFKKYISFFCENFNIWVKTHNVVKNCCHKFIYLKLCVFELPPSYY